VHTVRELANVLVGARFRCGRIARADQDVDFARQSVRGQWAMWGGRAGTSEGCGCVRWAIEILGEDTAEREGR
jgi:hypothetical protein